jgi:uncharacterized membrane protein
MTSLNLLLLGHILGTVTLVGGAFMLQVLAILAGRSASPADLVVMARSAAWVGPRVFMPAAIVVVATGAALASRLGYAFDEPFLLVGLGVVLAASATGPAYLAPEARRISRLVATNGDACPEARLRLRRLFLVSRVELALLVAAVAVMVLKPGL